MLKIDENQAAKADAFYLASIYGVLKHSVPIVVTGSKKNIGKHPLLYKLFEADTYRSANFFMGAKFQQVRLEPGSLCTRMS